MSYLSTKSSELLKHKLAELRARGINPATSSKLKEQFSVEFAYNLLAIQGSKLSLTEAYKIATGISIYAPVEEVQGFINLRLALDLIISSALKDQILEQHLVDEVAKLIGLGDCKLGKTLAWLRMNDRLEHPIDLAVDFILEAECEAAKSEYLVLLLINHIFMRARLPLTIILYNDRKRYARLLAEAKSGQRQALAEFVNQAMLRSLETELEATDADDCQRQHLSLQELSQGSEYSEAYLRKLALSGKLEAYKIGRNWMSTREALANYTAGKRKMSLRGAQRRSNP